MTTDPTPALGIAAACDRWFALPAAGVRLAPGGTIRLPDGGLLPHPAGEAAPLPGAPPAASSRRAVRHTAPPPPLSPSLCHAPPDQGWCTYCEPRAFLARMQAAFPPFIQVAGRVVG
jgi:hypothetical protein